MKPSNNLESTKNSPSQIPFRFAYCNSNSLTANFDKIEKFIFDNNVHLFTMSESWLNERKTDILGDIQGYTLFRNDRGLINLDTGNDTVGGGVVFRLQKSIRATKINISKVKCIGEVEYMLYSLFCPNKKFSILLCVVYRPPNGDLFNAVFKCIGNFKSKFKNLIITGDFNCHLENFNDASENLCMNVEAIKSSILNTGPTYHISQPSWLDIVIVDSKDKILNFKKSEISVHQLS